MKPICHDCIVTEHKQHDFVFLEQVAEQQRAEIAALLAEVEKRTGSLESSIQHVCRTKETIVDRKARAESEINAVFQKIYDALKDRQLAVLNDIGVETVAKTKTLTKQVDGLADFKSSLASSSHYVQRVLDTGSNAEILLSKTMLVQRLVELKNKECVLAPQSSADLWLTSEPKELIVPISTFCTVHAPNAVSDQSTATGSGLNRSQIKDQEIAFVVSVRDAEGQPALMPDGEPAADANVLTVAGVLKVEASLLQETPARTPGSPASPSSPPTSPKSPSGGAVGSKGSVGSNGSVGSPRSSSPAFEEIAAHEMGGRAHPSFSIEPNGNSTFTCRYTAPCAGTHRLSVTVLGRHVPNSPFTVIVVDPAQLTSPHQHRTLTMAADGGASVWATGCNGHGQLGVGHTNQEESPIEVDAVGDNVVSVACGYSHTVFVKADRTVWSTGGNGNGQLGLGHTNSQPLPTQVCD
jgi:hypothetical protein